MIKINKKERIAVFRCKDCVKDLEEYNPYIDSEHNQIPKSNIELIEVPSRFCEIKNINKNKNTPIRITGIDMPFVVRTFEVGCKYFKHFNNAKKYALERALKNGDSEIKIYVQSSDNDFIQICEFKIDYSDISVEYNKHKKEKETN